jgi:hypothetical protein
MMGVKSLIVIQWPQLQYLSLSKKRYNLCGNHIGNVGAKLLTKA